MSHPEEIAFFTALVRANPALIRGAAVLEIGSWDLNGSIRQLFGEARTYLGVDLSEGPGVDLVSYGHEVDYPDNAFDITLSAECFEHDPHWRETFLNMVRLTRPGGLVAFSCASRGRVEHGTLRTTPKLSPGAFAIGSDSLSYYRNLSEGDFVDLGLDRVFDTYKFWYLSSHCDLYFAGVKAGGNDSARLPTDEAVNQINTLMSRPFKMLRAPLRGLARVFPDRQYQSFAIPLSKPIKPLVIFFEYQRTVPNFSWRQVMRGVTRRAFRTGTRS